MREIRRLKIPILLICTWVVFYGFRDSLMTIAFLGGFMGLAMLIGHLAGKEIFGKYKWDVGERLNLAWQGNLNPQAILAVGMLMARVLIYAAIVIGMALCLVILRGNAFGSTHPCTPLERGIEGRARTLIPILKEEHARIWPQSRIEVIASQIGSESAWREKARRVEKSGSISYGLMQVVDATLLDMRKRHKLLTDLEPVQMLQARWSIRSGILYDKDMWKLCRFADAAMETNRYAFMLSAYNGGFTWVQRDRLFTGANGYDKNIWFSHVERFSKRSQWAFSLNRKYVSETLENAHKYEGI